MKAEICQSCRIREIDIVDPQDNPDYPYRLCRACHQRLIGRCLRPLEYFNIKALHGETYLLHDDFYDDDGTANAPEYPVFADHRLAFPQLDAESNNLEHLVNHAIVSFWLRDELVELLKKLPKQLLLNSLDRRLKENSNNAYKIFQIAARALGPFAANWVRAVTIDGFSQNDENETISMYSEMLAFCLPPDEGFGFCVEVLNAISTSKKLNSEVHNLIYFRDERTLDWIEANIDRMGTLHSSWGRVATDSRLSWERVARWLERGRPISLVALDGLYGCAVTAESPNAGRWSRENPPRLIRPASIEEMNRVLLDYLKNDNVPRTRNQITYVIENWDGILKSGQ